MRRVLDSYHVFGWSLYQVCEVQRSASEIHRAPVQIGLTGTVKVSTKVSVVPRVGKRILRKKERFLEGGSP